MDVIGWGTADIIMEQASVSIGVESWQIRFLPLEPRSDTVMIRRDIDTVAGLGMQRGPGESISYTLTRKVTWNPLSCQCEINKFYPRFFLVSISRFRRKNAAGGFGALRFEFVDKLVFGN